MDDAALALVLARAVAHELGNLLQPLSTALRYAQLAPPAEVASHLDMAREAVEGCQAIGQRLRTAAFAGGERQSFSLHEALVEASEGLAPAQQVALRLPPASPRLVEGERGAVVLALAHLFAYAAEGAGSRGGLEVHVAEAGFPVVIQYGPRSPPRDDPAPLLDLASPAVRVTSGFAMAWVLATRALGPGSLRAAQGGGSGRIELGTSEG